MKYALIILTLACTEFISAYDVNTDVANCSCDVTFQTCDYYCCCDQDCGATLLRSWNKQPYKYCKNTYLPSQGYMANCLSFTNHHSLYQSWGLKFAPTFISQLFCVYYDNSPNAAYYYNEVDRQTNSSSDLGSMVTNIRTLLKRSVDNSVYTVGDAMWTKPNGNYYRHLLLPSAGPSGVCILETPAEFMITRETYCSAIYSSTNPLFQASTYLDYLVGVNIDQTTTTTITSDTTNTGVIIEGNYLVTIDSTTLKIKAIQFSSKTISTAIEGQTIKFKFGIKFLNEKTDIIKSGNVGYLQELPILTANSLSVYNADSSLLSYYKDSSSPKFICGSSAATTSFKLLPKFNQDMIYSCTFTDTNTCQSATLASIYTQLNSFKYIAKYGSASTTTIENNDWILILNNNDFAASTTQYPSSIAYTIFYSQRGAQGSFIYYILGANRTVAYSSCTTTSFKLSINYIYFDPTVVSKLNATSFQVTLHDDLFYPFSISSI